MRKSKPKPISKPPTAAQAVEQLGDCITGKTVLTTAQVNRLGRILAKALPDLK